MDAIQIIRSDHREVERLLAEFERAERAGDRRRADAAVRSLVRALSVHASIEEQLVYPALAEAAGERRILDALEDHHATKVILDELDALPAGSPRLASKVRLLAENVRRHVAEEERELLPALARGLDAEGLRALGDTLARARDAAPTRPHPASPDTPPGNLVASPLAAILDRSRDAVRAGAAMLRTLATVTARGGMDGTRRAAGRARASLRELAGLGREAVDGARARGREAMDGVRAAADRVEVRGAEAARDARRTGSAAAHAAKTAGRSARRTYRTDRARSGRARRRAR